MRGRGSPFPHVPFVFYVLCNEMKVRATYFVSVLAELPRRGRQGTSSFHSYRQPHVHAQPVLPQDGSKSTALSFSNPFSRTFLLLRKAAVRLYTFCFIQRGWICPNIVNTRSMACSSEARGGLDGSVRLARARYSRYLLY